MQDVSSPGLCLKGLGLQTKPFLCRLSLLSNMFDCATCPGIRRCVTLPVLYFFRLFAAFLVIISCNQQKSCETIRWRGEKMIDCVIHREYLSLRIRRYHGWLCLTDWASEMKCSIFASLMESLCLCTECCWKNRRCKMIF